jgi:hypothetical protein
MAATYPLQVVELERWLQNPENAALKDEQLAMVLAQQPWDPSVKSLALFPQTVQMMDANLRWTAQLGDSFIAQQDDVMDSVQRLRQRAQAAGTLTPTAQQNVATQDQDILIQPRNPDVIFVPVYNATTAYGSWPYPDYPPVYFAPPPTYIVSPTVISFGAAVIVVEALRGWHHWDWRHHHMVIDDRHYIALNQGRPSRTPGVWQHDPSQRHDGSHDNARDRVAEPRRPPEVRHVQYEQTQPFPVGAHDDRLTRREQPVTTPVSRRDTRPVTMPIEPPRPSLVVDPSLLKPVPLPMHPEGSYEGRHAHDTMPAPQPRPRPSLVVDPSLLKPVPLPVRPEGSYEGRHARDSERVRPESGQPVWQHHNVQREQPVHAPQPQVQPRSENAPHAPAPSVDGDRPERHHNDRQDNR